MSELLDYTAEEMTGMSLYALCHGEDVHKLKNTHEDCKFFTFFLKKQSYPSIKTFFFSAKQGPSHEQLL